MKGNPTIMMWIFAEPMAEGEINEIQSASHERTAEFERNMMGIARDEPDNVEDVESDSAATGDAAAVLAARGVQFAPARNKRGKTDNKPQDHPRFSRPAFARNINNEKKRKQKLKRMNGPKVD